MMNKQWTKIRDVTIGSVIIVGCLLFVFQLANKARQNHKDFDIRFLSKAKALSPGMKRSQVENILGRRGYKAEPKMQKGLEQGQKAIDYGGNDVVVMVIYDANWVTVHVYCWDPLTYGAEWGKIARTPDQPHIC